MNDEALSQAEAVIEGLGGTAETWKCVCDEWITGMSNTRRYLSCNNCCRIWNRTGPPSGSWARWERIGKAGHGVGYFSPAFVYRFKK